MKLSNVFCAAAQRSRYLVRVLSALSLLLFASVASAQNTITTVAGSAPANNVSPTGAALAGPQAVVRDASGNLFIVNDNGVIYEVPAGTPAPTMVIYGGNNTAGFSPNGTLATSALTHDPTGAAVDIHGNLFFADQNNCVVREITTAGVMNTVAGTPGECGYSGDNGAATSARLSLPQAVAIDGSGNLYIADIGNSIIRLVASTGTITTYAGTPQNAGFPTNNVLATSTQLAGPVAVAVDANGNLFIADQNDQIVCRVDVKSKFITIVAGTGRFGFSGDGGPATAATMRVPDGVAVDSAGNIYISDAENAVVREVFASGPNAGEIQTIVGTTTFGFNGDGAATSIELTNPAGLFVDPTTGNLWIADFWANRIRLYTASTKTVTTVVGSGLVGDGGLATSASFYFPRAPALDSQGNLYIVDAENNRIREVDTSGNISTVVGITGIPCAQPSFPCGDGGLAKNALIFMPRTVTIEANGDLLVSDDGDNRIREVSSGNINTVVGSGNQCGSGQNQVPLPCGDGGPALSASLNDARGAVRDAAGNIFFVDAQDNRVREVDTTGTITSIAGGGANDTAPTGCGNGGYTGDNGPAVNSTLNCPLGLDIDSAGDLFVADTDNNVIRKIDTGSPRIITTIAGNGTAGHTGDGGLATSATLNSPDRVSVNGAGNFFISDSGNNVIRRVDGTSKIITAFAGNGTFAFAGDGGPALSASFATPVGVVVTPEGNMYVGDVLNNRIRKVLLNPNVAVSTNTAGFANQPINVAATPFPVTVTNSGDAPLTISNIALTGASVFSLAASTSPCPVAPATLAVGAQCVIEVAFTPTQFVTSTGTITITDNAPTATQIINVTGTGAAALTVTTSGSGTGTVTSAPAGITACATTCTANFTGNSQVALTAAPGTNSTFGGFSTNCTPTNALSCTVTMSAAETVTAIFAASGGGTAPTFTLAVTPASGATGNGVVSDISGAINCTLSGTSVPTGTCSASFPSGTVETLTGVATDDGSIFTGWSGPCTGIASCAVTMNQNQVVTARFTLPATQLIVADFNPDEGGADDKQRIDGKSAPLQVLLTNTSTTQTVNFSGAPTSTAGFTATTDCTSLAPGQSCHVFISFTATSVCQNTLGTITLADNDPGGSFAVVVNGYGADTGIQVNDLTNSALSAQSLAQSLVGPGVQISNVTYRGAPRAAGNFTSSSNIIGFTSGIVLSSGSVRNVVGPNCSDGISVDNGQPGDADLDTIVGTGNTTNDAAVLEFDFVPTSSVISFQYVFASDEYNEFVGQFNDVFGFFLTEKATNTKTNIALIPGTNLPVSINNVNDGNTTTTPPFPPTNPQFFINNDFIFGTTPPPTVDTEMDGLTVVFTAQAQVIPGNSYHIKLAIADADDFSLDSNVFIQAGSLVSSALTLTPGTVGFGNQAVGTTSTPPVPIVVQNAGSQTVTISSIAASANFTQTNSCPATLTAVGTDGASCTVNISFAPGTSGSLTGTLTVTFTTPGNTTPQTQIATLTGTGTGTGVGLTITEGGNGTGTVTSSPAGIACQPTCSAGFASGTVITLTAAGTNGSTFTGWEAGPCEGTSTCTFTITAATTVAADFAQSTNNFTLTVNEAGSGMGTVSSVPAGINCPATTCSASFASGTVVALTAAVADGSTFAGWSGAGCTGTGGCSVTMTAAQTVTATFNSGNSPVTIGLAPGSPSTVNTTPGSSAVFGLTLTSLPGTTGTVTLGCTSISPNITCNIVPSSITLTGKAINVAIVVNTFCKAAVPAFGPSLPGGLPGGLALLLASMSLCGAMWIFKKRPRLALSFGVLVLIAVGMSACSNLPKSPGGQATKPGMYPLVVTATAPNGAVSSVNLTLNVLP